ncbi:MAG: hypothetical protein CSB06_01860 [Bacteroidia bacterium]|nr:MAG: hypothetical protein CSB06_01860 [Bacteroidia bacterium]
MPPGNSLNQIGVLEFFFLNTVNLSKNNSFISFCVMQFCMAGENLSVKFSSAMCFICRNRRELN